MTIRLMLSPMTFVASKEDQWWTTNQIF